MFIKNQLLDKHILQGAFEEAHRRVSDSKLMFLSPKFLKTSVK